jgi:hypothetical protein
MFGVGGLHGQPFPTPVAEKSYYPLLEDHVLKKFFLVFAAVAALGLAACGPGVNNSPSVPVHTTGPTLVPTTAPSTAPSTVPSSMPREMPSELPSGSPSAS